MKRKIRSKPPNLECMSAEELKMKLMTFVNKDNAAILPYLQEVFRRWEIDQQHVDKTFKQTQMKEAAKKRPASYNQMSGEAQWAVDKELGILDWNGK